MLDIRFVREHPDEVKENIKMMFQDAMLPLVDEVINLDAEYRAAIGEGDTLRANRNKLSKQIGMLMGQAKKDPSKAAEAEEIKKQVTAQADRLKELETKEAELQDKFRDILYSIPQMIDPSVPIGPDDSCNVEVQRFGDPVVPDYPIPYHVDIMESFDGIDLAAAQQGIVGIRLQDSQPDGGITGDLLDFFLSLGAVLCHTLQGGDGNSEQLNNDGRCDIG